MRLPPRLAALSLTLGLSACTTAGPLPGTPEFAAAQVSRAYDCGLRVDRGRVVGRLPQDERRRFAMANAAFAVKSYKAPRTCDAAERASVQRDVAALNSLASDRPSRPQGADARREPDHSHRRRP